jgi:hypothetical protein
VVRGGGLMVGVGWGGEGADGHGQGVGVPFIAALADRINAKPIDTQNMLTGACRLWLGFCTCALGGGGGCVTEGGGMCRLSLLANNTRSKFV